MMAQQGSRHKQKPAAVVCERATQKIPVRRLRKISPEWPCGVFLPWHSPHPGCRGQKTQHTGIGLTQPPCKTRAQLQTSHCPIHPGCAPSIGAAPRARFLSNRQKQKPMRMERNEMTSPAAWPSPAAQPTPASAGDKKRSKPGSNSSRLHTLYRRGPPRAFFVKPTKTKSNAHETQRNDAPGRLAKPARAANPGHSRRQKEKQAGIQFIPAAHPL